MFNDEAVYTDALDHYDDARSVGDQIRECKPPYVIRVAGSWGSGKTSFLKKIWLYLGGDPDDAEAAERKKEWFGELPNTENLELIWFNPWQHQFEPSPVVALLHEIREHFSVATSLFSRAGKIVDVSAYSALSMLGELSKLSPVPLPKVPVKEIVDRGRSYETEHFATPLTSQRFRDFFEAAIRQVLGKKDRLVIFVDDLDRCEGDSAYRLLESLKLYLNAKNCVYILGIDQVHLEDSVAKVLSAGRPAAREYLSKMFQCQVLLPVPHTVAQLVQETLDVEDGGPLTVILNDQCGLKSDFKGLAETLDGCLPHNPRKVKAFIAAWRMYVRLLSVQLKFPATIDWRLTVILSYLAQFEEPLYRKVEQAPGFYSDPIVNFCIKPSSESNEMLFEGLELPDDVSDKIAEDKGGLSQQLPANEPRSDRPVTLRTFWISRLIREHAAQAGAAVSAQTIRDHLLRSGLAIK